MGLKASSNKLSYGLPEKFTQKTESIPTTVLQVVMNRQDEDGKSCINTPSNEMEGEDHPITLNYKVIPICFSFLSR